MRIPNSLFQKMQLKKMQISRQIDVIPLFLLHYPIKVFQLKTRTSFSYLIIPKKSSLKNSAQKKVHIKMTYYKI